MPTDPHRSRGYDDPGFGRDERAENDVLLLVGQLLESTKAATEGIKSLSGEVTSNSRTILAMAHTLKTLERSYEALDQVVREGESGQHTVVRRLASHQNTLRALNEAITEMRAATEAMRARFADIDTGRNQLAGAWKGITLIAVILVQTLTLIAALYAALTGK